MENLTLASVPCEGCFVKKKKRKEKEKFLDLCYTPLIIEICFKCCGPLRNHPSRSDKARDQLKNFPKHFT